MRKIDFSDYRPPASNEKEPARSVTEESLTLTGYEELLTFLRDRYSDRDALSITEVANTLGVSYASIQRRIAQDKIGHITIGRRILIPIPELARLLTTGVR